MNKTIILCILCILCIGIVQAKDITFNYNITTPYNLKSTGNVCIGSECYSSWYSLYKWNITGSTLLENSSGILDVNRTELNASISAWGGAAGWITSTVSNLANYFTKTETDAKITVVNSTISSLNGAVNSTSWERLGTDVLLANSGDDVGIGVTPSYKLEVGGTLKVADGNDYELIIGQQTGTDRSNNLIFTNSTQEWWIRFSGQDFNIRDHTGNTQPFYIHGGSANNALNLLSNGNVSILRNLQHYGDDDTYLEFTDDSVEIIAGGSGFIELNEAVFDTIELKQITNLNGLAFFNSGLVYTQESVTISNGVITAGDVFIKVAAETGTTDNLDTMNTCSLGQMVILEADTGDTITIREVGNIRIPGTTFAMNNADKCMFICGISGNWGAVSCENNN